MWIENGNSRQQKKNIFLTNMKSSNVQGYIVDGNELLTITEKLGVNGLLFTNQQFIHLQK